MVSNICIFSPLFLGTILTNYFSKTGWIYNHHQVICCTKAVCNAAITAVGRAQWRKALLLAQGFFHRNLEPNGYSCNALSTAAESWPLALLLLQRGSWCNLQENAVSWGTKAKVQTKWISCVELLRAAQIRAVEMETITCNTVLSSCQKEAEWQKCFQVLHLMSYLSRIIPE